MECFNDIHQLSTNYHQYLAIKNKKMMISPVIKLSYFTGDKTLIIYGYTPSLNNKDIIKKIMFEFVHIKNKLYICKNIYK